MSLVTETSGGKIAGYILLTELEIVSQNGSATTSLGVAPLAVHPEFQRQGIGGMLLPDDAATLNGTVRYPDTFFE